MYKAETTPAVTALSCQTPNIPVKQAPSSPSSWWLVNCWSVAWHRPGKLIPGESSRSKAVSTKAKYTAMHQNEMGPCEGGGEDRKREEAGFSEQRKGQGRRWRKQKLGGKRLFLCEGIDQRRAWCWWSEGQSVRRCQSYSKLHRIFLKNF